MSTLFRMGSANTHIWLIMIQYTGRCFTMIEWSIRIKQKVLGVRTFGIYVQKPVMDVQTKIERSDGIPTKKKCYPTEGSGRWFGNSFNCNIDTSNWYPSQFSLTCGATLRWSPESWRSRTEKATLQLSSPGKCFRMIRPKMMNYHTFILFDSSN